MRTKEEIIKEIFSARANLKSWFALSVKDVEDCYRQALDEHSKEVAIDFFTWAIQKEEISGDWDGDIQCQTCENFNQLFEKYLSEKQNITP